MTIARFSFFGHPQISARHRTTLEITKDPSVSARGDCIIGVQADFDASALGGQRGRLVLVLSSEGKEERVCFEANPHFSSEREIVIRRGPYLSERTLGTQADKSACELTLYSKDPHQRIEARIEHATATEQS